MRVYQSGKDATGCIVGNEGTRVLELDLYKGTQDISSAAALTVDGHVSSAWNKTHRILGHVSNYQMYSFQTNRKCHQHHTLYSSGFFCCRKLPVLAQYTGTLYQL